MKKVQLKLLIFSVLAVLKPCQGLIAILISIRVFPHTYCHSDNGCTRQEVMQYLKEGYRQQLKPDRGFALSQLY